MEAPGPGEVFQGRYCVRETLGEGAVARVFSVDDLRHGVRRALKLTLPHRSDVEVRHEAEVLQRLAHPNLVTAIDAGLEPRAWLVTELATGALVDRVAQEGPLAAREAVHLVVQVLDALQALHDAGMVHRDVKPENVLVRADGSCVLADLGICVPVGEVPEAMRGSRPYLAPEASGQHEVSASLDVYGAGALLYFLLTAGNPVDLHTAQASSPRFADLPGSLVSVLRAAVHPDPLARFPTAAAFGDALVALLPDLPTACGAARTSPAVERVHTQTAPGAPPRDDLAVLEARRLESWQAERREAERRSWQRFTRWSVGVGLTLLGVITAFAGRASMENWLDRARSRQLEVSAPIEGVWRGVFGDREAELLLRDVAAGRLRGTLVLAQHGESVGSFAVNGVRDGGLLVLELEGGTRVTARQVSRSRLDGELGGGTASVHLVRATDP